MVKFTQPNKMAPSLAVLQRLPAYEEGKLRRWGAIFALLGWRTRLQGWERRARIPWHMPARYLRARRCICARCAALDHSLLHNREAPGHRGRVTHHPHALLPRHWRHRADHFAGAVVLKTEASCDLAPSALPPVRGVLMLSPDGGFKALRAAWPLAPRVTIAHDLAAVPHGTRALLLQLPALDASEVDDMAQRCASVLRGTLPTAPAKLCFAVRFCALSPPTTVPAPVAAAIRAHRCVRTLRFIIAASFIDNTHGFAAAALRAAAAAASCDAAALDLNYPLVPPQRVHGMLARLRTRGRVAIHMRATTAAEAYYTPCRMNTGIQELVNHLKF